MPIRINADLPAKKILEHENIFVMDYERSLKQDIRPLKIIIMNLMPTKQATELQLLRSLSNTPLQVDITFLKTETHDAQNESQTHMETFYTIFPEIRQQYFDGLIITGAPVETLDFEEVDYWPELVEIMEWSKNTCNIDLSYLLGSTGRPLLSLRCEKRTVRRKDFRNLPASHYT
ncbi:MAG: homoserine O-acetyltransferase/O-succinyltransferase family protein [Anaerobutyricum hallii]